MKKSSKFVSVFLAIIMVLSVIPITGITAFNRCTEFAEKPTAGVFNNHGGRDV